MSKTNSIEIDSMKLKEEVQKKTSPYIKKLLKNKQLRGSPEITDPKLAAWVKKVMSLSEKKHHKAG